MAAWCIQAEERAEKEAQRQLEKDAKNREREEAKKMARYPIEDMEVSLSIHEPCDHAYKRCLALIDQYHAVFTRWCGLTTQCFARAFGSLGCCFCPPFCCCISTAHALFLVY